MTQIDKENIINNIVNFLNDEPEVRRIVIFGSFLTSPNPNDIDVAVFQDSNEKYLSLAMKYRKKTRPVSEKIALDIFPLRPDAREGFFMDEIAMGRVVYER
ncbi:MAG: nucleotidyltransferase domain-containing protein [Planctomycetaceae bacterium]|nr:nucleotidyltransferase domain-containing protein [Planctomycetaceae bacterium]